MGIRLDQLHSEVFSKISTDLTNKTREVYDYLDTKIAEIDVVFGLPEVTQVERDVEGNKRNLEKSGFIEINRNFTPFRTGTQNDTGVWVSNLSTNESPFEPRTIDGQKRGISVGGHILNYTIGNIGQNIDQMMKLPIAPNLPVFFPEDNDMVMNFTPSKMVKHKKVVTDNAIQITITKRITDEHKIDINKLVEGDVTTYYYMDEESKVFYLNNDGRSYIQTKPNTLLTEPYNRYNDTFGSIFTFEKIYNSNAVAKYIDATTNRLFEIKTPIGTGTKKVALEYNQSQVYLETMTVTRQEIINGVLQDIEVTQPMLVNYSVANTELNGMENQELVKTIISNAGFPKTTIELDGKEYTYIQDKNIKMFIDKTKLYYYNPYRIYALDSNGDRVLDTNGQAVLIEDESYRTYLPLGTDKPTTKNNKGETVIQITDNITAGPVNRVIHSIVVEKVSYYRIDTLMDGDTSLNTVDLDENGKLVNASQSPNTNRPVVITSANTLTTLTAGMVVTLSNGKEFYYHPEVGTKYYRKSSNGDIYYIDNVGNVYTPTNDVEEIFLGTITNKDTMKVVNKMIYSANGLMFYIDNEQLRTYIEDESKQQIQLTDVNGYRIFKKSDGTKIYAITHDRMVTIDSNGAETLANVSYNDIIPIFETKEVQEKVLNLVIPVAFNIIQGNVVLTRNGTELIKYADYEVEGLLRLSKDLEFNEDTNKGDTLYIKRFGKKDIILRLEKKGTADKDVNGHWANNTGDIVMPEPLTGNYFNWTEGQSLKIGEQLDYNDVVKGLDGRYYKYTGTAIAYEDMPADNKKVIVNTSGIFWEDITVSELEYERKGNNYKIFNVDNGDTIRFTIIRRVWEQHSVTGEMTVIEKDPYSIEKIAQQDGLNLFVINDQNFLIDDNASLESYILLIENIKYYATYVNNRANNFKLTLTGLQTVAKNKDAAMIYSEDYFLSGDILQLKVANINDVMVLKRIQAPQAELKINFNATVAQPKVTVPFEIIKNKFDIVIPQKLQGHEYTWIMGEALPEGKTLTTGDVVFDKTNIRFYKYIGKTKGQTTQVNSANVFVPTLKESLLKLPLNLQKEILRQYYKIPLQLNPGEYWVEFEKIWVARATKLSKDKYINLKFVTTVDGKEVLNTSDEKVDEYLNLAKAEMISEATHALNDSSVDAFVLTDIMTVAHKEEIKRILNTDLDQFVLKKIKYNADNQPTLDENGNIVYVYEYTRNFMVESIINDKGSKVFVSRTINGIETELTDVWVDITVEKVGYYRFGKTFTILDTKVKDEIVVRLLSTGAETFTSTSIISDGGEITFAIDFNIENEDGTEIPFEVIYNELKWIEGIDYIQEGQKLTLTMVEKVGQEIIIRRNDEFDLSDIVVLERKDLAFIEVWHEAVSDTGFIFPYGNVQYQGTTADGVTTRIFDHVFMDTINGETSAINAGAKQYCQMYQKGNIVYNYYAGTEFQALDPNDVKYIDETFIEDSTLGRGWKLSDLNDEDRNTIFHNADHNLYYDGETLVQVRYRTRVVGMNLFKNHFKGTSEYMSEGLRFQGKSPITSRIVTREIGEYTTQDGDGSLAGQPIIETVQLFVGGNLVISSDPKSLLYKEGKLFDDALFTVEEPTPLSHNGYVHAIPIAIVNRRNQGVYHPEFNDNGTGFFINGIYVSEDKPNFVDDITGFTLVDENHATLETSSVGRDRKAKFKVMLNWLFSTDYKAGGSMVSKTTYRPDGLLYDEINTRDIIDLRIDANEQRKRIEDLESDVAKGFKELNELTTHTNTRFEQTNNYINATANLIYSHIAKTEEVIRKDMNAKDLELTTGLETTNTNLADLSANVFTKDITTNLLIDSLYSVIVDMDLDAFNTFAGKLNKDAAGKVLLKPDRDYIASMINAFVENMEGPYTQAEFMKFLVTVLKSVTDKTLLSDSELDLWIKRLSVKDLSNNASDEIYTRAETLELIYEGLILASGARVLPPKGSDIIENWVWKGTRYDGDLGTVNIDLKKHFIDTTLTPVATKNIKTLDMTQTYTDLKGVSWNAGYIAGPTIWGNVTKYHAIYTTWIFVEEPFKLEYVKMNGDDSHAVFINEELIATNKYCCRDTAYSYDFMVPGWYRIDAAYNNTDSGHYIQLGWNPSDYQDKIKYMTTTNMDEAVRITKLRLDNWSSKFKTLVATIKGDASGSFTKLETKLILIEGLQRIRAHILSKGTNVTEDDLATFHKGDAVNPGLESWIDNLNNDGKFTSLNYDNYADNAALDLFRPLPNMTGKYNKEEIIEIIRKGLQLVNGIDSINSNDIQKWVDRLNISITMTGQTRYFTKAQVNALLKDGANYLVGLDSATSYEISAWLDNHITTKNTLFIDANGHDKSETTNTNAYTKNEIKSLISVEFKKLLGAQSAKTKK